MRRPESHYCPGSPCLCTRRFTRIGSWLLCSYCGYLLDWRVR